MPVLGLHGDAVDDLKKIRATDPKLAARIVAGLQELEGDPNLATNLTLHGFEDDKCEVSKWLRLWNAGLDIWRLRSWTMERGGQPVRLIYAYLPKVRQFVVLAIVLKTAGFDYDDPNDAIAKRVVGAFHTL